MSRGRFGALLAVLAAFVAGASFVGASVLLGDGSATPDALAESTTSTPLTTTTSATVATSRSTTTTTAPAGPLATPAMVVVVTSSTAQSDAQATRDALIGSGYDAGVLHSDDYPSLARGFWVAYAGPYASAAAADAGKAQLIADGYATAYTRCLGTKAECG